MAKQQDHGFETMAIVAMVALVALVAMFMNSSSSNGNIAGAAFDGQKTVPKIQSYDEFCTTVKCAPDSEHACCTDNQVLDACDGTTTLYCTDGDGNNYPPSCTVSKRGDPIYSCF